MNNDQKEIDVLRFPDNVRKRRGMYLMNPDHCVFEMIDNSVDEFAAGSCDTIYVSIVDNADGETVVTVMDNGSGIPMSPSNDPEYKGIAQAEIAYTVLHAGGKFGGGSTGHGYKTSTGGMNGVGASCVNAVSKWCHLISRSSNHEQAIDFERGITTKHCYDTGNKPNHSGTEVSFVLDDEVWGSEWYDFKHIRRRIQQLAFLNPGLTFEYHVKSHDIYGEKVTFDDRFSYQDGLKAYIEKVTTGKTQIILPEVVDHDFSYPVKEQKAVTNSDGTVSIETIDSQRKVKMDFVFTYTDGYISDLKSFVNNVATENGGDHETGFKAGIFNAIKKYAERFQLMKQISSITSDDCREGMIAILSIKLRDPNFEGQGKSRLRMPEVRLGVKNGVEDFFFDYLSKDPIRAKKIVEKVESAIKARIAAKQARNAVRGLKDLNSQEGIPNKLADCHCKDPKKCSIWLVEGDSAAGSAKLGRNREYQAILPVFGKIPNTAKMTLDKILKSEKLKDIAKALRCGMDESFDISKLRYHKIVLMSDADVDGWHIQCLHLTNFYRNMRPLIEAGYIYAACPPLFKVSRKKNKKEEVKYLYSSKELSSMDTTDCTVQRYKGLGEMSPEQLWDTTMNPETRRLIQITIDDCEAAEEALSICMGGETAARKEFILSCA